MSDENIEIENENTEDENKKVTNNKIVIPKEKGFSFLMFDWFKVLLPILTIAFCVCTFVFKISTVSGLSMADTLHNNDKLIMTNYYQTEPQSGDIVIISHGQQFKEPLVKRVIATQGQKIVINYEDDTVKVDGKTIDESYIYEKDMKDLGFTNNSITVPQDMVFVMGDNRNNSLDSRSDEVGLIPVKDVIGKAQVIVSPINRIQYLY